MIGGPKGRRARMGVAALVLGLALAAPAMAAPATIDPRLAARAAADPDATVAVWVTFVDKGEQGPADLAAKLAAADAALEPRARARRVRAGVHPLVDAYDLPVAPAYLEALRAAGHAPRAVSRWMNGAIVDLPVGAIGALAAHPFVAELEPVPLGTPIARPLEALPVAPATRGTGVTAGQIDHGQLQAALAQINVTAVHDSGYIGTGRLVCILDEGFNFWDVHEAFAGVSVIATRDFVEGDLNVQDTASPFGYNHGTWTMGCLAGRLAGTYVGAAYGASFMLGRTENNFSEKPIEMVHWGLGAEWADSAGADVISSSLGYSTFDSAAANYHYADMNGHTTIVTRAAEIAASKGLLVVTAAGNEGNKPWHWIVAPADANGDSVVAVGAVDASGIVAAFSSRGPSYDGRVKPDLAARGVSVPLVSPTAQGDAYTILSGTSFSTPIVAGLATCLLQARPGWTPTVVIRAMRKTASRANNPDTLVGYGIPNGLASLRWTVDTVTVPPSGPTAFGLRLAGPNPLAADGSDAVVRFDLDPAMDIGAARVRVFDTRGRLVRDLTPAVFAEASPLGAWVARWDGRDDDGRRTGAGVYFIALESAGRRASVRVVSLR